MAIKNKYIFIAGVPKSGTSYLFDLLSRHKSIIPSNIKETNFFLDQNHPLLNQKNNYHKNGIKSFQLFFKKEKGIRMEGSCHMFNQDTPLLHLNELGDLKIVIILRNPIKRLYSSFNFSKNNLSLFKDSSFDFSDYISLLLNKDLDGLQSKMRKGVKADVLFNELEMGNYASFIQKWKNNFHHNNLKIIQFEHLVNHAKENTLEILNWLSLENNELLFKQSLTNNSVNINKQGIHYFLKRIIPTQLRAEFLKNLYYRFQGSGNFKTEIDDVSMKLLKSYYTESNRELSALLVDDFDLELWE